MTQDEINENFQNKLQELNKKYQDEYNSLCEKILRKSLDAQIYDKLKEILEKNLVLSPCGFFAVNFDCTLYPPEIARIRDVLEKGLGTVS